MPAKLNYEPNQRIGCLTVICEDGQISGRPAYRVICDCGMTSRKKSFELARLRVACSNSCSVRPVTNLKHGAALTADFPGAYRSWLAMRQRCLDPNTRSYKDYGGRGIKICDRWNDFANFLEDMGERPAGMTIDREKVNGHYEPGNCRWATTKQQSENRR